MKLARPQTCVQIIVEDWIPIPSPEIGNLTFSQFSNSKLYRQLTILAPHDGPTRVLTGPTLPLYPFTMHCGLSNQRDSSDRFGRGFLVIGRATHVAAYSVPKVFVLSELHRQSVLSWVVLFLLVARQWLTSKDTTTSAVLSSSFT